MLAAVDLDQLAVVLAPQSRLMEVASLFARQPEPGLHHPFAKCLAGDLKPMSLQQDFRRQRRPEITVVLPDQFQSVIANPSAELVVRRASASFVNQRAAPAVTVPGQQSLRLPYAHTASTVAAEAVVRLPTNTSVMTSIHCKSRRLTVNHPKASLPGLLQKSEGRHFYFAEIGHFRFALTYKSLLIGFNDNEIALAIF
jgi:hypothetical protein